MSYEFSVSLVCHAHASHTGLIYMYLVMYTIIVIVLVTAGAVYRAKFIHNASLEVTQGCMTLIWIM